MQAVYLCVPFYAMKITTSFLITFQWTQLNNRKANLTRLLQKMQTYQYEQISADPDRPLGDNIRALTDTDIERYS